MAEIKNTQPEQAGKNLPFHLLIPALSIVSGFVLTLLLPVGIYIGIGGIFDQIFLVHVGILILCVLLTAYQAITLCRASSYPTAALLSIIGLLVLIPLLYGLTPVTSRDALVHHLAVPKWWLEKGTIYPIPWHEWSYYPMLINLGFTGLMKFGLTQLTSLYHFCYLFLLSGTCACITQSLTRDKDLTAVGFILPLSLPICLLLGGSPLVDLGLAYFAGTALYLLYAWAEEKRGLFIGMMGIAALGLASSCKYNGFLFSGFVVLFLLIYALRVKRGDGAILSAYLFGGTFAALAVLPWLARNFVWKANPLYPLFQSMFGASQPALGVKGLKPLEKLTLLYGEQWYEIALLPFRMILFGQDNVPQAFDGVLSPILLLFLIPVFFKPFRSRAVLPFFFLICLAYFYSSIFLTSARIRYAAPLLFPVIVMTLCGLSTIASIDAGKYKSKIYAVILTAQLGFAIYYSYQMYSRQAVLSYLFGGITKSEVLSKSIPEYPMIQFINDNLSDNRSTYLLLTGNKFYYYDRSVISGGYFSQNSILRWIRFTSNEEQLLREFHERDIHYLLLHNQRTLRVFQDILNEAEKRRWNAFEKGYLTLLHADSGFSLWKIAKKSKQLPKATEAIQDQSPADGEEQDT